MYKSQNVENSFLSLLGKAGTEHSEDSYSKLLEILDTRSLSIKKPQMDIWLIFETLKLRSQESQETKKQETNNQETKQKQEAKKPRHPLPLNIATPTPAPAIDAGGWLVFYGLHGFVGWLAGWLALGRMS